MSGHLVTHWPRWQGEALVDTLPNRLAKIKIQIIGHTLAKVPVGKTRDLKIRRRRVSTTAAVSWAECGEVAVVWREKLTLRSTVAEADGFITSFRGLSVFK